MIYLLYGDEDYLIKAEIDELKRKHVDASDPFGFETIDGTSATTDDLISAVSAAPMFGGKRTVLIVELFKEKKRAKTSLDPDKLISALKMVPSDHIVIFSQTGSIDKRLKLVKFIEEAGTVKEFKPYAFWERDKVITWVVARALRDGKKIGAHAAELLVEIVGSSLRLLDKEIEKLVTFVGEKIAIEIPDIKSVASSGEAEAFALSNSVRDKDLNAAMQSLDDLFRDREAPAVIIGMLAQLYRNLLQVKSLEKRGQDQYEIARSLGAKPYFVKKYMERTRIFSLPELKHGMELLHEADLKLKSGGNPRIVLELLVSDLCGQRA